MTAVQSYERLYDVDLRCAAPACRALERGAGFVVAGCGALPFAESYSSIGLTLPN
jgi:hypothetical protein